MNGNIIIYIAVMAITTYLIRMLPLVLIRNEITNKYIKSFLYYVPFVTLAVMVFPAILYETDSIYSAIIGFVFAIVFAFFGNNLITVSLIACASVFLAELIIV